MKKLLLDSLEVQGFRAFKHLSIERLGRVNLIAGKNNVGKSSLLEALLLYARRGRPLSLLQLLENRDERNANVSPYRDYDLEKAVSSLRFIFYGREDVRNKEQWCSIGPRGEGQTLKFGVARVLRKRSEKDSEQPDLTSQSQTEGVDDKDLGYVVEIEPGKRHITSLERAFSDRRFLYSLDVERIPCIFASANGLKKRELDRLWDIIALTDLEEDVLASLKIIAPEVERVNMISYVDRDETRSADRIPIVKIRSHKDPIPLRSLGEGMNRLFGLALGLASSRSGMLLVDEIESGLHYSIQQELWRFVFQVAKRLNVQVFATTHSWDCIEAFQVAAREDEESEGMLIRLESENGNVGVTLFDERRLSIATREHIEVR